MWVDEGWVVVCCPVTSAHVVCAFECEVLELMTPLRSMAVLLSVALPYCPGHLTCQAERRGYVGKENSLPAHRERRLLAFWGTLNSSELAWPISRRNQMQIKQSLGALAVQCSLSAPWVTVSHCAHSNGLPCELLSSVCVFSFLRDDSSQVKGHFSSDKTFLLLSEFCVCFLAKPPAAWAWCAVKHFPFFNSKASQGLRGVLTSIAWSEYHSSIAIYYCNQGANCAVLARCDNY